MLTVFHAFVDCLSCAFQRRNNKEADQTALMCRVVCAFVVHMQQSQVFFHAVKSGFTGSVVVDFLFIVTPIVGVCNCSMFCCTLLYVYSSIAIILMGKRELIALLNLSSWCLVMVERLFLAVPRVVCSL